MTRKPAYPTRLIREGNTEVLVPQLEAFQKESSEYAPSKAPVFYNPVMELNRDIAVIALQAYQTILHREISVCEPLTGCGIRGIRYAKEVKGVKNVVIGDINENAIQLAKYNVQKNRLLHKIQVAHENAGTLLTSYSAPHMRFDVVDIDPFGSPAPYLDSAVCALRDGGLMALTATDMAQLCGVHPRACFRKYGGKPLRAEYCHELAVRLLAGCLAVIAARHDIGITVLFSHSIAHYVRLYAVCRYGAKKADESLKNLGFVQHCFRCFHRETTKKPLLKHLGKCSECSSKLDFAGPLWLGKILDRRFCALMDAEAQKKQFRLSVKIDRILTLAKAEADAPALYYVIDKLCGALNLPVPPVKKVAEALKLQGYNVYFTSFNSRGIRTDAPAMKVKEVLRALENAKR
ncbi:tRNA (guanine(10)-N(2))-dimethyltransferase [Candidatus Bathyarchaeota archaeon]|nr:tRNA (guanine(10)-N(2))-dimethyltransferase [Candidatus Bathyarchaeota archaeon]